MNRGPSASFLLQMIASAGTFVQLVAVALPHVEDAPCLDSRNRGKLPENLIIPEAAFIHNFSQGGHIWEMYNV